MELYAICLQYTGSPLICGDDSVVSNPLFWGAAWVRVFLGDGCRDGAWCGSGGAGAGVEFFDGVDGVGAGGGRRSGACERACAAGHGSA